ncbi:hypothetical protein [Paraburkholderia atlantica]|uniref:hypothetical protein n=1 Tax=Paraburkholderia atlantica TaxID=2654982 RepID=UPI001D100907|nr:hypothetical protein [Paraburkholderia atlantica]
MRRRKPSGKPTAAGLKCSRRDLRKAPSSQRRLSAAEVLTFIVIVVVPYTSIDPALFVARQSAQHEDEINFQSIQS